MDQDKLLAILKEFDASSAVSLRYKEGETELALKKDGAYKVKPAAQIVMPPASAPVAQVAATNAPALAVAEISATVLTATVTDAKLITIKSPIVGTFYRQPSPDAPAYVDIGTKIQKGMALCILEAMKMMNTLESEHDGVIEEILAKTGALVEFDQPLFTVRIK